MIIDIELKTGQPPGEGEYVLTVSARQSGETDDLVLIGSYHFHIPGALAKPGWKDDDFWVPYGDGGFWLRLPREYYRVHGVVAWLGPLAVNDIGDVDRQMHSFFLKERGVPAIGILRERLDNRGQINDH